MPALATPNEPRPRNRDDGWLYFISEWPDREFIKIGMTTKSPELRIGQLQTGNARQLEILTYRGVPDIAGKEYQLHHAFASDRVHGEWFRNSPALQRFITELQQRHRGYPD